MTKLILALALVSGAAFAEETERPVLVISTAAGVCPPPYEILKVCFHCSASPSGLMSGSQIIEVVMSGFGMRPPVSVMSRNPL